jgi:uncharacterized protein YciI
MAPIKLTATLLLLLGQLGVAQGRPQPTMAVNASRPATQEMKTEEYKAANKSRLSAYVVLLRLRYDLFGRWKDTGKWPDDKEANQALAEHGAYWAEQLKRGRVILTGGMNGDYWDNVAMIIFEADSENDAKALVANDPAVKAYVFQAQVRPFDVTAITNKYGKGQ